MMMKKNKYKGNIEKEKLKLRVKQLELEKQMRREWEELKSGVSLNNFLFHRDSSTHYKKKGNGLFAEAIDYGLDYLTTRVSDIASKKIEAGIKKAIEKLKTVFNK
jgi:hypothetical protein